MKQNFTLINNMNNWETIDFTGKGLYKIYTVRLEGDNVVLVTQNILWNITREGKLEKLQEFNMLFGGLYELGKTKTYLGTDRKLFARDIKAYDKTPTKVADIAGVIVTDGDNIATIDDKVKGSFYSPTQQSFSFSFPGFDEWNNNFYVGMVLIGKKLYWLNAWGARNYYDSKKNTLPKGTIPKPERVIWEFDLEKKTAKDITGNLDCNNMLGEPFGPVASLIANQAKTKLILSTEVAVYESETGSNKWTKIAPNWGNKQLFLLPDDSILAIDNKEDKKVISVYKNGEWIQLPDLKLKADNIVLGATKRDNNIYVSFFERKFVVTINIFGIKPDTSNKPALATYVNIANPTTAALVKGQPIVATADALYSLSKKGIKQKIVNLTQQVSEIIPWQDGLLLAGAKSLDYVAGNKIRTIHSVNAPPIENQGLRVAASSDFIAYLHNKNLRIFDRYFNLITSKTIDGTFVNDIAVIDNQIYIVGFHNRTSRGTEVQIAFLYNWELANKEIKPVRSLWYYNSETLGDNMADTRLYRAEVISDKILAVLGECAGGNTIYRWKQDLKTPALVKSDIYNDPYNSSDPHMLYYGLVNLEKWEVKGQFSIPRGEKMKSNSNRIRTIFSNGTDVFIGSGASYSIFGRDVNKFADSPIPTYIGKEGADAALLKVDLDLNTRKSWLTPGPGEVLLYTDKFAIVAAKKNSLPTTPDALPTDTTIATNTYFVSW